MTQICLVLTFVLRALSRRGTTVRENSSSLSSFHFLDVSSKEMKSTYVRLCTVVVFFFAQRRDQTFPWCWASVRVFTPKLTRSHIADSHSFGIGFGISNGFGFGLRLRLRLLLLLRLRLRIPLRLPLRRSVHSVALLHAYVFC